ncbi:MAG: HD domain-containing protein [Anaerovoracaceae bacterium]|jgi:uncharacterized protein
MQEQKGDAMQRENCRRGPRAGSYPDEAECLRMLAEYGTPQRVINHCREVTRVAVAVGERLNQRGFALNIELVRAAGLLHDIARVEPRHWEVGARVVRAAGYDDVADIIAAHMTYPQFSPAAETNETDLVCLGDRTVREDTCVGVEARMAYIMDKARRNAGDEREQVLARIERSKEKLTQYVHDLEKIMGCSMADLLRH